MDGVDGYLQGAFTASVSATLVTCDFPKFRTQLERRYRTHHGFAEFDTIEQQLQMTCVGNDRGGIVVEGVVWDRVWIHAYRDEWPRVILPGRR
jgi:hypothetical protein